MEQEESHRTASRRANRRRPSPRAKLAIEALEERTLLATLVVNSTADNLTAGDAACTLREAITNANNNNDTTGGDCAAGSGADTINFSVGGGGAQVIAVASLLPTVVDTLTIDGTSQPGFAGTPLIAIDANGVSGTILTVAAANSAVRGLRVANAVDTALALSNADIAVVDNVDVRWTLNANRPGTGIRVDGGSDDVTIQNVRASGRNIGVDVFGGSDVRVLTSTLTDNNSALVVDSVASLALPGGVLIVDNDYSNSGVGLDLRNLSGLVVSDGGAAGTNVDVLLPGGLSTLGRAFGIAIQLSNVDDSTIQDVSVSWTGSALNVGTGILAQGGSDNLTIQNVSATNRQFGIDFRGGADVSILANDLSDSANTALRVANATANLLVGGVSITDNDFTGSSNGVSFITMSDLTISDGTVAGTNVKLTDANGTHTLNTIAGIALQIVNVDNVRVESLDLSGASGLIRSGTGLELNISSNGPVTVRDVTATNRNVGVRILNSKDVQVRDSDVSDSNEGLLINNVTDGADADAVPFSASGITFTADGVGLQLIGIAGIVIGDQSVVGADVVLPDGSFGSVNLPLFLRDLDNSTIDNVDVAWTGTTVRTGNGIFSDSQSDSLTIQNVKATNRNVGIQLFGGSDVTLTGNDVTNNNAAIYLDGVGDGGDANTVPAVASANTFTNSGTGLQLFNVSDQFIGTAGTGIIINNAMDGLRTLGTPIYLRNVPNMTIDGLDLSHIGPTRSGAGILSDSNLNANVTIQNVTATNRNFGIQLQGGGQDLTLTNLNLSDNNIALSLDSFSDAGDANTVPIVSSGVVVTNSGTGMQLFNIADQFIGTAGTGIIVNNATDGLKTTDVPLYLRNLPNSTIDGLDLAHVGATRRGIGIFSDSFLGAGLTIQNVTATNRGGGIQLVGGGQDLTLTNNDLSNNDTALSLDSFSDAGDADTVPIVASGNVMTNSGDGIRLANTAGQFIGTAGTGIIVNNAMDGLQTVYGTTLFLRNVPNSTIDGLDLSFAGPQRRGNGIFSDCCLSENVTIQNVTVTNRVNGIQFIGGGQDLTLTNNNLSNNDLALFLDSFSDGADADTVPVVASGNVVANSGEGFRLFRLNGQFIGTAGTGIIINNANDGLQTVTGNALFVRGLINGTIENIDVSYDGPVRTGVGIFEDGGFGGSNVLTISGVTARNRNVGIFVASGSSITIQNSALTDNNGGIVALDAADTTVVVNNRIERNVSGLQAQAAGVQVNAENNFWGSAAGPGSGGNNGFTGNVDADPFLAAVPAMGVPVDFAVSTATDVADGDTSSIEALRLNRGQDGFISLREAIIAANNTPGPDVIRFQIGMGPQTITLGSALPTISDAGGAADAIDGSSQPGYAGVQLITIDFGGMAGTPLTISNPAEISDLAFVNVPGTPVSVTSATNVRLRHLALDGAGAGNGLAITGSQNVFVQDITVSQRNRGIDMRTSMNVQVVTSSITANTLGITVDATTFGVLVTQNRIEANGIGLNNANAGETVFAENNFWGPGGGPGQGGNNGAAGNVDADPFLNAIPQGIMASTLTVNTPFDVLDGDTSSVANLIASPGPDGKISLREAIVAANGTAGPDTIRFAIGSGMQPVFVGAPLPQIIEQLTIDGSTQTGFAGEPLITIDAGGLAGFLGSVFEVTSAPGSIIRDLAITNYFDGAVRVSNSAGAAILNLNLSNPNPVFTADSGVMFDTGSDLATVQNVNTAGASQFGIQVVNSANPTIQNNILDGGGVQAALVLNGVTGLAPGAITGNTFANSENALRVFNMAGIVIGDAGVAGAHIVLPDGAAGLNSVTGRVLDLFNLDNSLVDGLDISFAGPFRSGIGTISNGDSDTLTIRNVSSTNRSQGIAIFNGSDLTLADNTLSNTTFALFVTGVLDGPDADTAPFTATGQIVANSNEGYLFSEMTDVTIGTAGTSVIVNNAADGLQTVTGNALSLRNLPNLIVDGLDLSFSGPFRAGAGIISELNLGDNVTIQNVTAMNRNIGFQLQAGGTDLTLTNNNLSNNNLALYLDNFADGADADTVPVIAAGNVVTNSSEGFRLFNLLGQFIGTAGTGIIVNNAADGLNTVTGNALYVRQLLDSTIDGLDVSFAGGARSGTGIFADGFVGNSFIQNVTASNRSVGIQLQGGGADLTLTNNDLSNTNIALVLENFSDGGDPDSVPVVASGNVVTNSSEGFRLFNLPGQFIGTAGTGIIVNNAADGLNTVTGNALYLRNVTLATIDGLDLSFAGILRSGTGIFSDCCLGDGVTIQNVTATNRGGGIQLQGGGSDLTLTDNNLSNTSIPLYLDSFADGADADTVPVVASGNEVTGSNQGFQLFNLFGQFIGTAGTGIIVDNAADGLQTVPGVALYVRNITDGSIDGLDLSFAGSVRSSAGIFSDSGIGTNVLIQNVTATNRVIGVQLAGGVDVTITNNDLSNNNAAVVLNGFFDGPDADTISVTVAGNAVTNSDTGVVIQNSFTPMVSANVGLDTVPSIAVQLTSVSDATLDGLNLGFSGAARSGVGLLADGTTTNLMVQNSQFTNRGVGVDVQSFQTVFAFSCSLISNNNFGLRAGSGATGVSVSQSVIQGNAVGVENGHATATLVAENNFWGVATGANTPGGDITVGTVDADPFLSFAPLCVGGDFGDAPDSYATLKVNNGPRHADTGPRLGPTRDFEADGQPNATATGDDAAGPAIDDEDGVTFGTLVPDPVNPATATVTVNLQNPDATANRLDAWIDFNQDGIFDNGVTSNEHIFANFDLGTAAGPQVLTLAIPAGAPLGVTFARFRLSTIGGLAPTGPANDGEVEDYQVTLVSVTTTVALDGSGNLVVTDTGGGNTDDSLTIRSDTAAGAFVISDPNNALATNIAGATGSGSSQVTVPFGAVAGTQIILDTLAGNDVLTVDFSGGNFSKTITFNAGDPIVGPGDSLVLAGGGTFTNVTHTFTSATDGSVSVAGNSSVNYFGLEPITDNLSAIDRVFTFSGGDDTITLSDAAGAAMTIDSTLGESVTFANPSGSVTISAGTGNDVVTIVSLDSAFAAAVTVTGDTGADTINVNATVNTRGLGAISLNAETIALGANLETDGGAVSLTGNVVVTVAAVTIDTETGNNSTPGAVTFAGGSVSADALARDFVIDLSTTGLGNAPNVTLPQLNNAAGQNVRNLTVTATSGTGTPGDLSIANDAAIDGNANLSGRTFAFTAAAGLTAAGNVTLDATSGVTADSAASDVTSVDVTITAGASGIGSLANPLRLAAATLTTNTAAPAGPQFLIEADTVTIAAGGLAAGTQTITLAGGTFSLGGADRIDDSSPLSVAAAATLMLNGFAETIVELSGAGAVLNGSATTLTLTLNQATNTTFSGVLGGATADDNNFAVTKTAAGTLTLSGTNTYTGATSVNGGRLNVNGSTAAASAVLVAAAATIGGTGTIGGTVSNSGTAAPGVSPGILNTGDFTFQNSSMFAVEIGGTAPGNAANNHDQLNVTGTVTIGANVTLSPSSFGGFTPAAGNSFVIINNDGADAVAGTFAGLPQGSTLVNFLGTGLDALVNYAGGSGNDVTLTVVTTVVSLDGAGNLVVTDTAGGTSADTITITADNAAGQFVINDPANVLGTVIAGATGNGTNTVNVPFAAVTGGQVIVNPLAGADSVTIAATGGSFPKGLNIDGGAGTDTININNAVDSGGLAAISLTGGTINLGANLQTDGGAVNLTSDVVVTAAGVTIDTETGNNGTPGAVTLSSGTVSANAAGRDLTINTATTGAATAGAVSLAVFNNAGGQNVRNLTVTATGGSGATAGDVTFTDDVTLGGNLGADGRTVTFNANANLIVSGTATVAIDVSRNVVLNAASSIDVVDGNLTIAAGAAGSQLGNFAGILLNNATVTTSGTGNINLTGRGGSDAPTSSHNGVRVMGGGKVRSTAAALGANQGTITLAGTGGASGVQLNAGVSIEGAGSQVVSAAGDISVTGQGGAGTGVANIGVFLTANGGQIVSSGAAKITINGTGGSGTFFNYGFVVENAGSLVSSVNGDISITGQGGTGTGGHSRGVVVLAGGQVVSTGAAKITIAGTGGTSPNNNWGVGVEAAAARVSSATGDVTITGQGGTGTGGVDHGVFVLGGGVIESTGAAKIAITGTGGGAAGSSSNDGVHLETTNTAVVSTAAGSGTITVTGTPGIGASSDAIELAASGGIRSTNTNVTLIGDSMNFAAGSAVNAGANTVTLRQGTNGALVNLGGADAAATLGLTDAELDLVTAGTIQVGDANSGAITVSAAITRAAATNLIATTGGNNGVTFVGASSIDAAGGDVTLTMNAAGTGGVTSGTAVTDVVAAGLTVNAGSGGVGAAANPFTFNAAMLAVSTGGNANQFLSEADTVTIAAAGLNAGTGTIEFVDGVFSLGGSNRIGDNSNISLGHRTTLNLNDNSDTIAALVLEIGTGNGADVNTGVGTLTLGGNLTLNTINAGAIGASVTGNLNLGSAVRTFTIDDGGAAGDLTVSAVISNGSLTKAGIGTLALSGGNTYAGATTIDAGTLLVNGSTTAGSTVAVNAGATLGGAGSALGTVNVNAGGTLAPGSSPNILRTGPINFAAGSTYAVEIDGATPGPNPGGHDQLIVTGTVMLDTLAAGVTLALSSPGGFIPAGGNQFLLVANDLADGVAGNFAGLPEDTVISMDFLGSGQTARISYTGGDGNDVVISLGGQFTLATPQGDGPNVIVLRQNGLFLELVLDGAVVDSRLATNVAGAAITGVANENDTLRIDYETGGQFNMAINFAGGAGGNDSLEILGGNFTTATYNYTNANDGSVQLGAGMTVNYTGLEPILNTGTADDVVFNLPAAAVDAVLEDDAIAGDDLSRLRSNNGTFETTTFRSPTNSLTLNFGDLDDTVTLAGADRMFAAHLSALGAGGRDIITALDFPAAVTLAGGPGNDVLTGTRAADKLIGGSGDDNLVGGAGLDLLEGDQVDDSNNNNAAIIGNDTLEGGAGPDVMIGGPVGIQANDQDLFICDSPTDLPFDEAGEDATQGCAGTLDAANFNLIVVQPGQGPVMGTAGSDLVIGSDGDDVIDAGLGDDILVTGDGNDVVIAGDGNDSVAAGPGDDSVFAGVGDDNVFAGEGDDTVTGGQGGDLVVGGLGDDVIDGGVGADSLVGGPGDDIIVSGPGDPNDFSPDEIQCGAGDDIVFFRFGKDILVSCANSLLFSELQSAQLAFVQPGVPLVVNDPQGLGAIVIGTRGSDTVTAAGGGDFLLGRGGNDFLNAAGGNDTVAGGVGNDTVIGGDGIDAIFGGTGNDCITGGDALPLNCDPNALASNEAEQAIAATRGAEIGSPLDDFLEGGPGNDTIFGGDGNDVIIDLGINAADSKLVAPIAGGQNQAGQSRIATEDRIALGTRIIVNPGTPTEEPERTVVGVADADGNEQTGDDEQRAAPYLLLLDQPLTRTHAAGERVRIVNDDVLMGEGGNDTLVGGPGNDRLTGGPGNDLLLDSGLVSIRFQIPGFSDFVAALRFSSGGGDDTMDGGSGDDTINGGPGNDLINGGPNDDLLVDVFIEVRVTPNEDLNGDRILNDGKPGAGHGPLLDEDPDDVPDSGDEVDFNRDGDTNDVVNEDSNALAGNRNGVLDASIVLNPGDPLLDPDGDGIANLNRLSQYYFTSGDQPFQLNSSVFVGAVPPGQRARLANARPDLGGNDTIRGDDGNDTIAGGTGEDMLFGGAGDDVILGALEADEHNGVSRERPGGPFGNGSWDGNDTLDGGPGRDLLIDLSDRSGLTSIGTANTFVGGEAVINQRSQLRQLVALRSRVFGPSLRVRVIVRPGRDVARLLQAGLQFADSGAEAEYLAARNPDGTIDPRRLHRAKSQLDIVEQYTGGLGKFLQTIGINPSGKSKGRSAPARPDRVPATVASPDPNRVDDLLDTILRGF